MAFFASLKEIGARPAPVGVPIEEEAPDKRVATKVKHARHIYDAKIRECKESARFFVDGVQRSLIAYQVEVPGLPPLPLITSHVIVGACERDERYRVRPVIIREAFLSIFPAAAVEESLRGRGQRLEIPDPDHRFDHTGNFYIKVSKNPGDTFFVDSSVKFELPRSREPESRWSVSSEELAALGKLRSVAQNRVKAVMRALELGVVCELRKKYPSDLVVLDGPLASPLTLGMARLADTNLVSSLENPYNSFKILRGIVGVVKNVQIVPHSQLHRAFQSHGIAPVFRFVRERKRKDIDEVAASIDDISEYTVNAFVLLRPELARSIPITASPSGGLVRFDVPIAAFLEEYDPNWRDPSFELKLKEGSSQAERLEEVLSVVYAERLPVPSAPGARSLVELYPIYELELLLKSMLADEVKLREIARSV